MTITAVTGQQGGATVDSNATASGGAYAGNVTSGNLIVFAASKFDPGVSLNASDCTKASGTATIGTVSLDKVIQAGNIAVGIWSAIVTGSGSLTMQAASTAGSYWAVGRGEFASSVGWDASRVEDSDSASGTSTAHVTPNMVSAGAALFVGASALDAGADDTTYTQEAAFTRIYRETDASAHEPGVSFYRIVSTGTTDAAESSGSNSVPYVIAGVVYKEAAAGGAAADAYVSMPPLAPPSR